MKLYIITGVSRGLGAALAEALIDPAHQLICMARSKPPLAALRTRAKAQGCRVAALSVDLGNPKKAATVLQKALANVDPATCTDACLINNAGVVEPIGPADKLLPDDISAGVLVNLAAPMALTAAFLRHTAGWNATRKVLNISSGAAHKAYAGWSMYGATKAALDQFTRCVALEQQGRPNGARIVALAPGVIDTAMQTAVRNTPLENFAEKPRFVALKENGQLTSPAQAAQRLLDYLERPGFGSTPVDDVRRP
ncbi:MAG: SDR family NAD(P)-dependent oxidoreductase [Betaproteobacteria bacterium]|nr:SDR family NAD(P)-dependent oxidoreductase [Betaproteobacteria bacterium]